ncbi:type 4a pilus biogenesis protein PilO [Pseudomonas putida CSV86]|uniref:Type 4a pilus biogenesis protein PilO n=1 Tax=Pseudomonas bharatica CSV86 TaxID=1005395 RepID=L1M4N3_9PSED|nr:pilus assembly protein PilP [Pseudomonas bharatica]NNJ18674.1 type 4a pilus biogenesis protein PilO [Pseudomonas bharatica CSV86]
MNLALIDDLLDWRLLLRWPWWAKGALLAACLSLPPGLVLGFHGRGVLDSIARAQERHDQLQQQWQTRSAKVDTHAEQQAQLARLEDDLRRRQRELFDEDGLASLLQSLGQLGAGLSFEQVSALEPEQQPNHVELPLLVRVSGDYRALKRFLAGLGGLERLVTLHEVHLVATDEASPGVLRLGLRLQAYRALQSGAVAVTAVAPSTQVHNPFEPFVSNVAEVSLDQVRMVGYLRDPKGQAALVRLGAEVHLLRKGDRIGSGQVVAIEEGRVELQGVATGIARVLRLF